MNNLNLTLTARTGQELSGTRLQVAVIVDTKNNAEVVHVSQPILNLKIEVIASNVPQGPQIALVYLGHFE